MKSLYYRSQKVGTLSLLTIAVTAILIIACVEWMPGGGDGSRHEWMLDASRNANTAIQTIGARRRELGHRVLAEHDPAGTGMIGPSMSLVTSLPGHLTSKQTSVNPNFAAVAVHYLLEAGVGPGDEIAIGCTGSFPALNISVLAAARAMGLKPTLISSASSSQFGANDPRLMWPEMERLLTEQGVLEIRSLAVSRGGLRDRAAGMTEPTRRLLDEAIARSGRPRLECDSLRDSIDRRMQLYSHGRTGVDQYAAYINIGGGAASVGGSQGNEQFGCGLIQPATFRPISKPIDSVASRFLAADVPLINMIHAVTLAKRHGLSVSPTTRPQLGEGDIYRSEKHRRPLAALGILLLLGITTVVVRPPIWFTQLHLTSARHHDAESAPRWMV